MSLVLVAVRKHVMPLLPELISAAAVVAVVEMEEVAALIVVAVVKILVKMNVKDLVKKDAKIHVIQDALHHAIPVVKKLATLDAKKRVLMVVAVCAQRHAQTHAYILVLGHAQHHVWGPVTLLALA